MRPRLARKTQGNAHQESGNINDSLTKYQYLKVSEVWFWQNNEMSFYQLVEEEYIAIESSLFLSGLTPNFLVRFVNRGLRESPLIIEADFIEELANNSSVE